MATKKLRDQSNDLDGEFFGYECRALTYMVSVSEDLAAELRFCVDSAELVIIEVGSVRALLLDIISQAVT